LLQFGRRLIRARPQRCARRAVGTFAHDRPDRALRTNRPHVDLLIQGRCAEGASTMPKEICYALPIVGHVTTVTRGVSVSNAATGAQGLPNVDPVSTWVTLAQRVPVRIAIDDVPQGVPLVSGTTATVTIRGVPQIESRTWYERTKSFVMTSLSDAINGVFIATWLHSGSVLTRETAWFRWTIPEPMSVDMDMLS
jgi:hypothetical protein